ncbi:MAG: AMP-binding protein, partial [Candidatus Kapabacteria bacterium]|nr:AMP-binding protein [Candidatus Kapabacteria bacterium]
MGANHPVAYWEQQAERLVWSRPWKTALVWKHPHAKWFVGGTINAAANCLDRHLDTWRRTKAAIIWEAESGEIRTITYQQLHADVCRMANALTQLGIRRGDVVGIYMGMVPEAMVAMLACARIGAAHNVVFGGFSADALRERMNDSKA